MGLSINLFVHGVPMGQKVYGPKGEDVMYINSFYGPKWDAPELLKVDVMTFGGVAYCYYSFVKGENVCDSQGRAGSYFALTLRINALYADFQNMYSILKAAYTKMCVGLCVQDNGNVIKYKVAEFDSIEPQLKAIEQHIVNYISEFSVSEDIVPASGLKCNANQPIAINLHECTQSVAIRGMQSVGKLFVSPYYPSSQTAQQIAKFKTEMQNIQLRARQEIEDTNRSYEDKLRRADTLHRQNLQECNEQAEARVRKVKEEGEQKINEIHSRYADADMKIENLKKEKTQIEKEKKNLQTQLKEKDDSISKLERRLDQRDEDIERMKKQIDELKTDRVSQLPIYTGVDAEANQKKRNDDQPFFCFKKALTYLVLFFILAFVVLGVWYAWDQMKSEKDLDPSENILENVEEVSTTTGANDVQIGDAYISPNINIIWGKTKGAICPNEKLKFEFGGDKNLFDDPKTQWSSKELVIKDDQIELKPDCNLDSCRLSLMVEGQEYVSIIIPIQK